MQRPELERACRYLFLMNFLFSSTNMAWIPRLSEVKETLGLNNQVFGGFLAFISAGYLLERFGSPVVITSAVTATLISFSIITWSPNTFVLGSLVLLASMSGSALYIGLSGLQIAIQQQLGRPIIAKMHAASTVGFLLILVLAGVISPFVSVRLHITLWTLLIAPFFLYCARQLPSSREFKKDNQSQLGFSFVKQLVPRTRIEFLISYALLCSAMVEISTQDWMAIYAHESLGIALGPHVTYFILFCLALILVRWRFHYLLAKYGPVNLIMWGAIGGGAGFALGIFLGAQTVGHSKILGWSIAGIGVFLGGLGLGGMQAIFLKILGDTSGISLGIALARVYLVYSINVFFLRLVISAVVQHTSVATGLMVPAVMLLLTYVFAHLSNDKRIEPFSVYTRM
jgi:hypothetical protein